MGGGRKQILLDEWSKHRDTNGDARGKVNILIFEQYIAEISQERSQTNTRIRTIFVAIKDLENAFASHNKWSQTVFCNIIKPVSIVWHFHSITTVVNPFWDNTVL